MHITFHGVRGSTPCHCDDTHRYGGNTSCVALDVPGEPPIVFDLGTGLRYFGAGHPHDEPFRGVALLTHFHWDHVQGLPFFSPILHPDARFDVFAPRQDDDRPVADVLADIVRPPVFPVRLDDLPGVIEVHEVGDDDFSVGSLQVRSRFVPHNGPTLGYRVDVPGGPSVAYVSDHQQTLDGPFELGTGLREMLEGVDLLIHDAQYAADDFERKRDWGHCTPEFAFWVAREVGAGRLALYHHDPARHDADIDRSVACLARLGERHGIEVFAAAQGQTVTLG
jgi:phosphoribosyl 1,2-cyclic phosphodiesterase